MIGDIARKFPLFLLVMAISFSLGSKAVAYPTILVVGDSLSAAYQIPEETSWVPLLKTQLSDAYPDLKLVNSSYSGDTTTQALGRLPMLLEEHTPDWVLIEVGGNDGLRGLPLKHIEKNLERLITRSKEAGSKVMLLAITIPPNYGPRYQQRFFELYAKLAEKHDTLIVPFLLQNVVLQENMMQQDGIHPTEMAQPIIMQNVLEVLKPALEQAHTQP